MAAGHSLERCSFTARGATSWGETSAPDFGSYGGCATPAKTATWGQIQQLYR